MYVESRQIRAVHKPDGVGVHVSIGSYGFWVVSFNELCIDVMGQTDSAGEAILIHQTMGVF